MDKCQSCYCGVCVSSVVSDVCDAMDCSPPGSSVHGILQARILERLPCPPPGELPNPGTELTSLMSPALAGGGFLPLAPPGKAKAPFRKLLAVPKPSCPPRKMRTSGRTAEKALGTGLAHGRGPDNSLPIPVSCARSRWYHIAARCPSPAPL